MLTPDEHNAIIEADRLWWEQMGGVYESQTEEKDWSEDQREYDPRVSVPVNEL